ncbi:hypothetical protein [Actinoplanes sp. NPDC051494]|uniref:hypothetical protein n=1 Tax=Actinoplanes sp. NPDC051494 TaxID=3363907 RepID=UPI0037886548
MAAGSTCRLHDRGAAHIAALPVGVVTSTGDVIPADRYCAAYEIEQGSLDHEQIVPFNKVNAGWVRS